MMNSFSLSLTRLLVSLSFSPLSLPFLFFSLSLKIKPTQVMYLAFCFSALVSLAAHLTSSSSSSSLLLFFFLFLSFFFFFSPPSPSPALRPGGGFFSRVRALRLPPGRDRPGRPSSFLARRHDRVLRRF